MNRSVNMKPKLTVWKSRPSIISIPRLLPGCASKENGVLTRGPLVTLSLNLTSTKALCPMLRIELTESLEKQYEAAVKIHSIRVVTVQPDCVTLELEIEIFEEAPSRTYVEITI